MPGTDQFVVEVVRGLAVICQSDDGRRGNDLSVPLGLSAWIVRAALRLPEAYDALLGLRREIVSVSGLDGRHEPRPLGAGDDCAALSSMGVYLYGLVRRAARHADMAPTDMAELVVRRLAPTLAAG
ncbi:MAG: hypothetical protein ACYDD4_10015 [Acidimicrobiales bacterium]